MSIASDVQQRVEPEAEGGHDAEAPSPPPAYCFHRVFPAREPDTVRFDRDYLLYAVRGAIRIEVDGRRWILAPCFAAWIPALTDIRIEITHPTECCSVLYVPGFVESLPSETVVFAVSSLARLMIRHSRRWGADGVGFDQHAETFFRALAQTCVELAATPSDVWRPSAAEARTAKAIAWAETHLHENVGLPDAASAAGTSERTLSRLLVSETGLTWAQTLRRLRMIRAVELLARWESSKDQITQVSLASGYASLSAFERAFREFIGLTPSAFRARNEDSTAPQPDP